MLDRSSHDICTVAASLVRGGDHEPPDVVARSWRPEGEHQEADWGWGRGGGGAGGGRWVGDCGVRVGERGRAIVCVDGSHPGVFRVVTFAHGHWVRSEVSGLVGWEAEVGDGAPVGLCYFAEGDF